MKCVSDQVLFARRRLQALLIMKGNALNVKKKEENKIPIIGI